MQITDIKMQKNMLEFTTYFPFFLISKFDNF